MKRAALAVSVAVLAASTAQAQQEIQWKQVINVPKRLNQPQGITIDILGIELGDSFAEVKAKLEKLAAESVRPTKVEENRNQFRFATPGGGFLTATYPGRLLMERWLPGTAPDTIRESYDVHFSAPSSGQQAVAIERIVDYRNQADQPRISEIISKVTAKLASQPQLYPSLFRWQFNDGRPFVPANANLLYCRASLGANTPEDTRNVNKTGDCDVIFDVRPAKGISNDHTSSLRFTLSDNERTRQAVGADFQYFGDYARGLQSQSGNAPKL